MKTSEFLEKILNIVPQASIDNKSASVQLLNSVHRHIYSNQRGFLNVYLKEIIKWQIRINSDNGWQTIVQIMG